MTFSITAMNITTIRIVTFSLRMLGVTTLSIASLRMIIKNSPKS
jgi:hypothetical protein